MSAMRILGVPRESPSREERQSLLECVAEDAFDALDAKFQRLEATGQLEAAMLSLVWKAG